MAYPGFIGCLIEPIDLELTAVARCFFRHLKARWIIQESPIYHCVEKSLLYQNPLSVNSAKVSFSRYTT